MIFILNLFLKYLILGPVSSSSYTAMSGITAITKSMVQHLDFIDGVMKSYVYNTSSTTLNFSIGDK